MPDDLEQGKSEGLIAATGLVFLLKIGFKSLIFGPMWPDKLMEDLKKQ